MELRGFGFWKERIISIQSNAFSAKQSLAHAFSENSMVIYAIYLSIRDIYVSTLSSCKTYFEGTGACRKDRGRAFPSRPLLFQRKLSFVGAVFEDCVIWVFFSSMYCIDWHQQAGIKTWVLLVFFTYSGFWYAVLIRSITEFYSWVLIFEVVIC